MDRSTDCAVDRTQMVCKQNFHFSLNVAYLKSLVLSQKLGFLFPVQKQPDVIRNARGITYVKQMLNKCQANGILNFCQEILLLMVEFRLVGCLTQGIRGSTKMKTQGTPMQRRRHQIIIGNKSSAISDVTSCQRCKQRKNQQERPFFSKELAQHILAYFSIFLRGQPKNQHSWWKNSRSALLVFLAFCISGEGGVELIFKNLEALLQYE